ncbi:hypothetical protein J4227_04425 [Candidatus Woesearchaeota archaeon]|nr:hypothetical protein [Candidatus Woesearchaeota archaeon]
MAKKKTIPENVPVPDNCERVFVTFTDDVTVSDGEKELVVAINIEFAFDVPLDNTYADVPVLLNNSAAAGRLPGSDLA